MLSPEDASAVFTVLVEQFREADTRGGGKLLALDEAHKYLGDGTGALARNVVEAVRLMRHEGLRVAVSSQSPVALPSELLELTTVAVVHRFHSHDWFKHLAAKIALPPDGFDAIRRLDTGTALVFAARHNVGTLQRSAAVEEGTAFSSASTRFGDTFTLAIRPRLTADRGESVTNASSGEQ